MKKLTLALILGIASLVAAAPSSFATCTAHG